MIAGQKQIATYAIKNMVTGDAYVGSTSNWKNRKKSHMSLLRKGKHHSIWLQRAWNKYGANSFVFVPCFNHVSHQDALHVEDEVIEEFFLGGLYNCKKGAFGFVGCDQPKTEKHKKAMSVSAVKSWKNPEMRNARQLNMRGKRAVVVCPHCGLEGGGGNMRRYHFDNCKTITMSQEK